MTAGIRPFVLVPVSLIAALGACHQSSHGYEYVPARAHVDVKVDRELDAEMPRDGVRMKFATDLAAVDRSEENRRVNFRIRDRSDEVVHVESFELANDESFDLPGRREGGAPVELFLDRPAGHLDLYGEVYEEGDAATGDIDLELSADVHRRLRDEFSCTPTILQSLQLVCLGVDPDDVIAYRKIRAATGLSLAVMLVRRQVSPVEFRAFVATGRDDDDEGIQKLLYHGVPLDLVVEWHEVGRELSVDELIYCRQRGLTPEQARDWDAQEYELSIEQLYWTRQRGITAGQYARWAEAERALDLKELYYTRQRGITPDAAVAWQKVGRDMSLEQLYYARQRGIRPADARGFREHGYDFSLAELYKLRQHGVSPKFAAAFVDPAFAQPTADDLVEYRGRGIQPRDAKRLRRRDSSKR